MNGTIFRWGGVVLVILLVIWFASYYLLVINRLSGVAPIARAASQTLLLSIYKSRVTGGYWENEMLTQAELVSKFDVSARLDFYRTILVYGDLDTSRAVIFVEIVGNDAKALSENLFLFEATDEYSDLSKEQREYIDAWARQLGEAR